MKPIFLSTRERAARWRASAARDRERAARCESLDLQACHGESWLRSAERDEARAERLEKGAK